MSQHSPPRLQLQPTPESCSPVILTHTLLLPLLYKVVCDLMATASSVSYRSITGPPISPPSLIAGPVTTPPMTLLHLISGKDCCLSNSCDHCLTSWSGWYGPWWACLCWPNLPWYHPMPYPPDACRWELRSTRPADYGWSRAWHNCQATPSS